MQRVVLLYLFFVFVSNLVFAQDESPDNEASKIEQKAERDSIRAKRKAWNKENTIYKPIIGLGAGFFNYFGEVNNNGRINPVVNNYGFQASVIKNFTPSFGLAFDVAYGRMSAREQTADVFRNFSSEVVTFNLHATYNFAALLRPNRFLNPYISVGVGAVNFDAKGDLKDANDQSYFNWSDGTLRSLPEIASNESQASILRQDFVYETDLRKANLDSLGNYAQFAFVIPVTLGFKFKVSPRSAIRLSSTFSYAFTDLIDNVSSESIGSRKGDKMNDMFLFTSISYHFDFFTEKKVKMTMYDDMEFESLDGDTDKDGVSDLADICPSTPEGTEVDGNGCPLDSDNDGVYDYRDEEPNTDSTLAVNEKGVGITDDMIVLTEDDTLATLRAQMFEVYPDLKEIYNPSGTRQNLNDPDAVRPDFQIVDSDGNGVISINEVYGAIDAYFDGDLDVNAQFITDLIDYFFDQ